MSKFDFLFEAKQTREDRDEHSALVKKYKSDRDGGFKISLEKLEMSVVKLNNLKELTDLPKKDEHIFLISNSFFNAYSFFQFILDKKQELDYVMFVSYSFNKQASLHLQKMLENNYIKKCDMIMTSSLKGRYKDSYALLDYLEKTYDNFNCTYTNNHAKILLCKTGDDYYSVTGSGNFALNSRIEQYHFINNKELFDFAKERLLWAAAAKSGEQQ